MNAKQAKALRRVSRSWKNGELLLEKKLYKHRKKLMKKIGFKLPKDLGR